jgi:hypothetical protein
MPSKISTIATSKRRREMPKPRQILSKPSVAAAAAPTMTHPKTHLTQPDQNAGSTCGSIIDMPTANTIIQPAIDSIAAILILSFHQAIPSYPFQYRARWTYSTADYRLFITWSYALFFGARIDTKTGVDD